jgi:hypothetical protein
MSFLLLASGMRHIWKLHILMLVQRAYRALLFMADISMSVLGHLDEDRRQPRQHVFSHLKLMPFKELSVPFYQAFKAELVHNAFLVA